MNDPTSQYALRHELRGEFIVLRVLVFCSIIYLFLQVASMFRLFGVPSIPPLLLLSYRILDLLVIGSFFLTCDARVKLRWVDLPLFMMIPYPILIGFSRGYFNITFFNDTAIMALFLLKVLVIRTVIIRLMGRTNFDEVFRRYAQRIIKQSIIAAALMLTLAYVALAAGMNFYYQAPAELTFAAALAMAQGRVPTYLFIFAITAIGGKRGIMMGILAIGFLARFTRRNIFKLISSLLVLLFIAAIALMIVGEDNFLGNAAFVRRFTATLMSLANSWDESSDWVLFLMILDPNRFVEYVSLQPHLEGWAFWIGNGFGFRYNIDAAFLAEFGRPEFEGTATNAHFTPLAIVAKFGVVGLALWIIFVLGVLFSKWDSRSYFQAASRMGFVSMLVQAIFSYAFFISFFTPIFIAGATLRRMHQVRACNNGDELSQFTEER